MKIEELELEPEVKAVICDPCVSIDKLYPRSNFTRAISGKGRFSHPILVVDVDGRGRYMCYGPDGDLIPATMLADHRLGAVEEY